MRQACRDVSLEAFPAERNSQEHEHVDEVAELVETLVVLDATDRVHDEQVREVRDDREKATGERPAQRGQSAEDPERDEDRDARSLAP
jgi:hypothetical protein